MKTKIKIVIILTMLIILLAGSWEYFHYQVVSDINQSLHGIIYVGEGENCHNMDFTIAGKLYANRLGYKRSYFEGKIEAGEETLIFTKGEPLWLESRRCFDPDSGYDGAEPGTEIFQTNKLRNVILPESSKELYNTVIDIGENFQTIHIIVPSSDVNGYGHFVAPSQNLVEARSVINNIGQYTSYRESKFLSYLNYLLRRCQIGYQFNTLD